MRDELIRDVLLWIPTHGRAKVGRPARTYIQQLCEDTGCCPEDLPRAMNDRKEWRERVRDIRATSAIWWWWWYIYIYIYNLFSLLAFNSNPDIKVEKSVIISAIRLKCSNVGIKAISKQFPTVYLFPCIYINVLDNCTKEKGITFWLTVEYIYIYIYIYMWVYVCVCREKVSDR